ncbi:ChaN family lipoprotein [Phaeobacter sp. NW0010-22]|uniref:ChaN family lipoprotein n=1 Tax=Phaeobacter sp. NW0010-22 TaxID=3135907 RepID=UPI00310BF1FE
MRHFSILLCACAALIVTPVMAADIPADILSEMKQADVVILGEDHENAVHHQRQAQVVSDLSPSAMVWEMMTEQSASLVTAQLISEPEKMAETIRWVEMGWPPLAMYLPIFAAAPDAPIYGAMVPRKALQAALKSGAAAALGADAARYGLNVSLPLEEQAARELGQQAAHCGALPDDQLANFVQMQRLRDAVLARAVLRAIDETDGPVVVITGNGHARSDWGVPRLLARLAPGLKVVSLGQSQDGQIEGEFDFVIDSPAVERDDPCAVFSQQD